MALDQELLDRYQIEEALRRYCRGVDRGDAALIRSVYHPDAVDEHGSFAGSGYDFADRFVANTKDRWLASQHILHQTNIRFAGSMAWTESYFTAHHRLVDAQGETMLESFGGRYVDRFERRDGGWAIAKRVVLHDWSRVQSDVQEYPNAEFTQGLRSTEDLSYQDF